MHIVEVLYLSIVHVLNYAWKWIQTWASGRNFHLLTSSQWRCMQRNSTPVHNGMPLGTINSSRSSIGNWVSCLHDWSLLANAINYSRLSQLIALCNLTNPTDFDSFLKQMGFKQIYADACVYNHSYNHRKFVIIALCMDDIVDLISKTKKKKKKNYWDQWFVWQIKIKHTRFRLTYQPLWVI